MHLVEYRQRHAFDMQSPRSETHRHLPPVCGPDSGSATALAAPAPPCSTRSRSAEDTWKGMTKIDVRMNQSYGSIQIKSPPGSLPRTDANAIETEVLTYRYLRKTGLPVPSVIQIVRGKSTNKVTSALLSIPDGMPLSMVAWSESDPRRAYVQRQLVQIRNQVTNETNALFGTIALVTGGKGTSTWASAFALMLEALLEDGEDQFINIPYKDIRHLLVRSKPILDRCTVPRLVIPNLGKDSQTFVDQASGVVTGLLGCQEAFWGDARVHSPEAAVPIYKCYLAVKTIVMHHFRPSASSGLEITTARMAMTAALKDGSSPQR